MLGRALLAGALLAAAARTEKLPQQARAIKLADSYLPPPKTYLPPPSYLPPTKEYVPPPPREGGLTPPSSAPEGSFIQPPPALAPSKVESALPSPASFGKPIVISSAGSQMSRPEDEQSVVLDSKSAHDGFCPRRQLTLSCLLVKSAPKTCFSDVDCASEQKCCALNCGLQCVDAVISPSSCDDMVCGLPDEECVDLETGPVCIGHSKPGQCPFHGLHCSNRILVCRDDEQCEADKLCCNLGCHRLCVDPAPEEQHLGFCPEPVARPPTRCGFQCQTDDDCSAKLKCCDNACGKVCRPGVVPFITCKNRNCPSNTKCEMQGLEAVCRDLKPAP